MCYKAEDPWVWMIRDRVPSKVIENSAPKPWKCVRLTWRPNKKWTTWWRNVSNWVETGPKRLICIPLQRTVRKPIRVTTSSMFGPKMNLMAKVLLPDKKKIPKSKREKRKRFKTIRMKLILPNSLVTRPTSLCHQSRLMRRPWVRVTPQLEPRLVMCRIIPWARRKRKTTN